MLKIQNDIFLITSKYQNTQFKPHFHDTYSFALITDGECVVNFKNKTIHYKKNDFRIINPYEIHYVKGGIWGYKSVVFEKSFVNSITKEIINKENIIFKNKINSTKLNSLFLKMYEKQEENIYFFFEELLSFSKEIKLPKITLKKSIEYIDENFTQKIKLENLAYLEHISKYHFLRLFKNQTGLTPHQYIIIKRLNFALELMKKEKNLAYVAVRAGFSDQSHFIKEFKKVFGFTPKEK
ncbi:AraC family transcriptional regulator [Caminibacter pacificus]|uniref:AraC family transcriptional regulator n=1 Tax=Caminibacter pacificus TaxID=1424653 RepID=A0AAJ4RAR4_9BACT|nr:AraC family transcriptional regulator [Caminibacter pacificus]QCI29158.1 AraC family transcriptional regulator [Caminibacter pacificus]ROR38801.1 AraC family transcriptional regulator [Caminibacter pacificus]